MDGVELLSESDSDCFALSAEGCMFSALQVTAAASPSPPKLHKDSIWPCKLVMEKPLKCRGISLKFPSDTSVGQWAVD